MVLGVLECSGNGGHAPQFSELYVHTPSRTQWGPAEAGRDSLAADSLSANLVETTG